MCPVKQARALFTNHRKHTRNKNVLSSMPLGIERINARRHQPNDRINFVKPLHGPDKELSRDFLERIAAIVNPIMKKHHIAVMSLEEYESNPEFLGRNFNAGEVIQLVLKTRAGHWMPFKFVQMVMIHELSHCKQMNHSKAFWNVRNDYADELKILWGQGYTGEGLWSRGISLGSGNFVENNFDDSEPIPEYLCGGTYQSSGRKKRKVKRKVSYKERQARRITKKFGNNGQTLGADDETKCKLEKGKTSKAKPRVASSARGRDLRAAAALARFEDTKIEQITADEDEDTASETESDDYEVMIKTEANEAVDINGVKLLDGKGRGMFKVCEDEDQEHNDKATQDELSELRSVEFAEKRNLQMAKSTSTTNVRHFPDVVPQETDTQPQRLIEAFNCPVCSMSNDSNSPTCIACANVLDESRVIGVWYCEGEMCRDGKYVNAEDCGVCGVCGQRKFSNVI